MRVADKKDVAWSGVVSIKTKESPELIELFSKVRTWPLDKNPEEDRGVVQYHQKRIKRDVQWPSESDLELQFDI